MLKINSYWNLKCICQISIPWFYPHKCASIYCQLMCKFSFLNLFYIFVFAASQVIIFSILICFSLCIMFTANKGTVCQAIPHHSGIELSQGSLKTISNIPYYRGWDKAKISGPEEKKRKEKKKKPKAFTVFGSYLLSCVYFIVWIEIRHNFQGPFVRALGLKLLEPSPIF